jgi:hypothetical protein
VGIDVPSELFRFLTHRHLPHHLRRGYGFYLNLLALEAASGRPIAAKVCRFVEDEVCQKFKVTDSVGFLPICGKRGFIQFEDTC